MKELIIITFLLICGSLNAQTDSLMQYSLNQLDSLCQKFEKASKFKELLPCALTMLEKGKKELNTQDIAYAKVLLSVGRSYFFSNKLDSAAVYFQKSIDIQRIKTPKHNDYARALNNLGFVYMRIGKYLVAEPLHKEAMYIRKELLGSKHPEYASSLNALAVLYMDMGIHGTAESLYKEALGIQKESLGDMHGEYAQSIHNLALLYRRIGKYAEAEPLIKQAVNIWKNTSGEKGAGYINGLNSLAVLYINMGNYEGAEPLSKQVLQFQKEVFGDKSYQYAQGLENLANLHTEMKNYTLAEPLYKESIQIKKEVFGEKHTTYAQTVMNLGLLYEYMGKYTEAEPLLKESLDIQKELFGEKSTEYLLVVNSLGLLYADMQNKDQATVLFKKALDTWKELLGEKHTYYRLSLNNLGFTYTTAGVYDTAQYYYAQLSPLLLNHLDLQGNILGEKAKQDLFNTVTRQINNINCFSALHKQHDSILVMVQNSLLLTKGYALAGVSELLPLVKSLNDSTLSATYIAWSYTKTQLGKAQEMSVAMRAQQNINLDSLQILANEQEAKLMQISAVLRDRLGYNKKRFYFKDLITNIEKDEVTIDFMRFPNEKNDTFWYYALINQQGLKFPKCVKLCLETELEPYASAIINPNITSYITNPDDNRALYDFLIRPLEPYLKKKKRVHYALVGMINQIALKTLKDNKGKMFGERFEVHQYGSLKDFIIKKTGEGSTGSVDNNVLLVGDIAFDLNETEHINLAENSKDENLYAMRSVPTDSTRGATRFIPLKGTKIEVENLSQAFNSKKWKIEQLQQKDALEERVREYSGNKTPKVLHFATHGFFIPSKKQGDDNPLLRSGIALAGANRVWMGKPRIEGVEDGLWTAYEIANIDLSPAELVVLSACETAKGQIDPHEGVVGLQRSFKIAGVENMLLSLWQVPDKETVELMQEFYKHYLNGETPSVSLHKAQETMRKKYPDPYYWAAFILIE